MHSPLGTCHMTAFDALRASVEAEAKRLDFFETEIQTTLALIHTQTNVQEERERTALSLSRSPPRSAKLEHTSSADEYKSAVEQSAVVLRNHESEETESSRMEDGRHEVLYRQECSSPTTQIPIPPWRFKASQEEVCSLQANTDSVEEWSIFVLKEVG